MKNPLVEFWRELWKDLQSVVILLMVVSAALLFFLLSYKLGPTQPSVAKALEKLGDLMVASLAFQLIMRAWSDRRSEEVFFQRLQVRDSLVKTGFRDFYWFDKVPWDELFREAHEVEVYAMTARMLTGEKIGVVRQFLKRSNTKLTVIIHDPEDQEALEKLDRQLGERPGSRREKTLQNLRELQRLASEEGVAPARFEIRLSRVEPSYTYYRFDDKVLYVPYLIKPNVRAPESIPVFVFTGGEVVNRFLSKDAAYVHQESKAAFDAADAA